MEHSVQFRLFYFYLIKSSLYAFRIVHAVEHHLCLKPLVKSWKNVSISENVYNVETLAS